MDEAGRGPLAGPVVAAAVILHNADDIPGLQDSKKLSEEKREALFPLIQQKAFSWTIAEATPEEIDRLNILQADFLAMRRALARMGVTGLQNGNPSATVLSGGQIPGMEESLHILVDGNLLIGGVPLGLQTAVVKGDAHVASIAAASILAKVHRDRIMVDLAAQFPQYGLEGHKGYPCPAHIEAIRIHGLSPCHRKSFKPKALDQLGFFG